MQRAEDLNRIIISSANVLIIAFVSCCAIAAAVIGAFPLELSIVTIFLFAGIHNLMEFRYFVARMPVRWGRSRTYYSVAIGGVVLLTTSYLVLYFSRDNWLWDGDNAAYFSSIWNSVGAAF